MANFKANVPQFQFNPNPTAQPNFIDSATRGMELGQSMGLRARQAAMQEEELQLKKKEMEEKSFDSFTNALLATHKLPKSIQPEYWKGTVAPRAQKLGFDLDPNGFDDNDRAVLDEAVQLIESHRKNPNLITRDDVRGGLHLLALKASQQDDDKGSSKLMDLSKEYETQVQDMRFQEQTEDRIFNFRSRIESSKPYQNYTETKSRTEGLRFAIENPGAFGDLGILFDYMKSLDPESVVREGEQQLFKATGALSQRAANALNKLVLGETLQPEQRQEILKYANRREKIARDTYKSHAKPTLTQAKRLGLPESEIDPFYGDDAQIDEKVSSPSQQKAISGVPQPGQVMKGFRFKGGDPSNKANWEKI